MIEFMDNCLILISFSLGVYKVEADFGKVTVLGNADPQTLMNTLVKKGKRVEILVAPKPDNQPNQNKNLQIDNSNGGGNKGTNLQIGNSNGNDKKGKNVQIGNGNGSGGENKKGQNVQIGNGNGIGGENKKGKNVQIGNGNGGENKKGKKDNSGNGGGGGGDSDQLNLSQNETNEEDDDDVDTIESSQLINKRSGKKPMKDVGQGSGQSMPNTVMKKQRDKNGNNNGGNAVVNGNQAGGGMADGVGLGEDYGYPHNMSMVNLPMGNFQMTQMGNLPIVDIPNLHPLKAGFI